ncbi:MAG TPA: PAS domain S-box protein [Humidesulfovibrio sp.]|uniref:PAS domain S-box protein n=1 Tax=Humidesulfovibrio sp. TaxID=2910988 RepID=UPI002CB88B4A|nr:PAS domain S-box protein [Humidesulfovibrio sp.]HWR03446.1 PAS domain S-box protein [Humidesulfovibrio sp.]
MRRTLIALLLALCTLAGGVGRGLAAPILELSPEERQWLDAHRDSIALTYDASFPPIEFLDDEGRYAGMGADIVAKLEILLGVTFRKAPTNDWNAFLRDLESGKAYLNAGMASTPERESYAACTAPYITLPMAIITTAKSFDGGPVDWTSLKGRRVAVVSGYMTESYVRRHGDGQFTVVPVGSVREGLRDVSFGVADAFVDNLATSSYYIDRDGLTNLRVAGSLDAVFPLGICVSRKYPLLLSAVRKALAAIPPADIEASRKSWMPLGGQGGMSRENLNLLKLAASFVVLLLICLAGISYLLKRRLDEKVRSLGAAQRELQEQTERLELALDATKGGVWELYPITGAHYYTNQWFAMLGRRPGSVENTLDAWKGLLHPDDLAGASQAITAYCESDGHGLYEAEFRMRHADGTWRWVLGKGRAVAWDGSGRPSRIIGLNLDIQKLKDVQEELRRSEHMAKAAFDQTFQLCTLLDTGGRIVQINKNALAFSGCSLPEMLGRTFWDCHWWPDRDEAERLLRADLVTVLAGGVVRREVVSLDAECRRVQMDFSLSPLIEADGSVKILIAEGRDISEIRRAEASLREKTAMLEAMVDATLDGLLVVDDQRRILLANRRFAELFKVPRALLDAADDVPVLEYVSAQVSRKEDFLGSVERLYQDPRMIGRDEIGFSNGMQLDRYTAPVLGDDGKSYGRIWMFRDITERKSLELRLADQLAFQEALLETIPYAMFYKGRDSRFLGFNRAYEDCFGVRRAELIGKRVVDLEYLPLEDRLLYQAEDEAVIAEDRQVHREMAIPFADGKIHDTLYSVSGFRQADGGAGGLIGIIVDISERKMAEERLRQSEEKFSRIFEMAPECIFFIRVSDNVLIDANAAFETVTGQRREDSLGQPITSLIVWGEPSVRAEFRQRLEAEGSVLNFEMLLCRKDGELRRVVNSSREVTVSGEHCYISVIHDITEQRRMQELLIQSEKMMSIGSLAAGIAHEINNPLGIVHQAVQNLIQRTSPEQRKNQETAAALGLDMGLLQQYLKQRKLDVFLEDIQSAALRASGIIRNMLNFSRRSESRRSVCDLPRIIEQAVFLASSDYDLKKAYDFKRIEMVMDLESELPRCNCTETELEQVVLNLLRNAAQAMAMADAPPAKPRIEIRLRAVDGGVRLEVSDNGPGMSKDILGKIFEPFFTTKPPGVGTGLGLAVSYFIITKGHRGKMWASSTPGQGTTFHIELPAEVEEANSD